MSRLPEDLEGGRGGGGGQEEEAGGGLYDFLKGISQNRSAFDPPRLSGSAVSLWEFCVMKSASHGRV